MIRNRLLTLTITAGLSLSLLAGCAARAPQTSPKGPAQGIGSVIELRALWWGSQDRHDKTLKAIAAYEAKHPNIKITAEYSGYDQYWDKVSVKAASGDAPDLIQMDYSYLNEYAGRNALLDLTPYVGQGLDLSPMDKNLVGAGKVGDKLYAIALGGNVQALELNKSMLDKAGLPVPPVSWTWADFDHDSQVVKDKLGPSTWFSTDASNNTVVFEYWLRQRGLPGMWNGTNFAFTEQDLADWWTYWDNLRKRGLVPNGEQSASYSGDIANSMWVKGKVATQFGYAAEFEKWATIVKDEVVMVPYPRGGQADGHYVKPSMYWSVYSKSKHPQEALDFINWFINDPEAAKILGTTRGVPVTTTALNAVKDAGLTKYDVAINDMTAKIMAFAGPTPVPAPKGSTDIGKLFTQLSQEQAFGRKTPAQAAKEFMAQGAQILKQANGK